MLKRLGLFILLISCLVQLSAQESEEDSLAFYAAKENGMFTEYSSIDFRPVTYTHLYRPLGRPRLPMARSSNIGLPLHFYKVMPQRWSLHYIQGGNLPYIYTKDSMRYFDVSRPVTVLNYENGESREQYFSVFHSQNAGEGLNITFEYERITSDGFFVRQLTNHTRFYSTYNLRSRNQRFESRGYFGISHLEAQESGGIFVDSVNQETDNPALLGINLFNAQNRNRGRVLGTRNSYKAIHLSEDSSSGFIAVFHEFNWDRSWRNYDDIIDQSNPFYQNYFIDSTQTVDTSKAEVMRHTFGLQLDDNIQIGYSLSEYNYFQNFFLDDDLSSQHFLAAWQDSILRHQFRARFKKGISGYHEEDFMLNASVSGRISTFHYKLFLDLENNVVDYFTIRHRTNQHFFNKSFEPTTYFNSGISLFEEITGVAVKAQLQSFGNYVYFDKSGEIQQISKDIQAVSISLNKEFVFLRNFHLMNKIHWQAISNEDIIPLPSFFSYHSLYYDNKFFKNSLHMQLGFDAFVISEYSGYAYSPEQAQFYLNPSQQRLGNIQQVDVFVNFGITQNGRFFIKMENLLEPTYSQASERIYQYPVPGRALKFGFSWKMIN